MDRSTRLSTDFATQADFMTLIWAPGLWALPTRFWHRPGLHWSSMPSLDGFSCRTSVSAATKVQSGLC
jgi:hypothetical protein